MARRLGSAYLWVALFLAILVGRLRDLIGVEALICGYAVFVALTAAAVWKSARPRRTLAVSASTLRSCPGCCSLPVRSHSC